MITPPPPPFLAVTFGGTDPPDRCCLEGLRAGGRTDHAGWRFRGPAGERAQILPIPSLQQKWIPGPVTVPYDPNHDSGFWDSVASQVADQWYSGANVLGADPTYMPARW